MGCAATPAGETGPKSPPDGAVGIYACDAWLRNMERCTKEKAPEPERARLVDELGKLRQSWRHTATTSDGRDALDNACRQLAKEGDNDANGVCANWRASEEEDNARAAGRRLSEALFGSIIEKGEFGVGVPACDEWMRKYRRCIDEKVPEAGRRQMLGAMLETAKTWRQTATTPEGRVALENACRQMIDSTRKATASMGCQW
jgi:hypothetical protein